MYAPQYKSLSISEVLGFALRYPVIRRYLPEEKDMALLPRQVSQGFKYRYVVAI